VLKSQSHSTPPPLGIAAPYLQLIRAPAVFTAASNILAAHLLATQGNIIWFNLLFSVLASMALYSSGMALNDYFDYKIDCKERPFRPLPSKRIALGNAWMFAWSLLFLGLLFSALLGLQSFLIAVTLAIMILVYNKYVKNGFLGPLAMGACRYLNWLLGLSVVSLDENLTVLGLPILLYIISLTILSQEEVFARSKIPLIVCTIGLTLTLVTMTIINVSMFEFSMMALFFVYSVFAYLVYRILKLFRSFQVEQIQGLMKILILGIIPFDALMVALSGMWWGAILVLSLIIPSKLLAKKLYVT